MIIRSTWPFSVSSASPPRPSAPALFDTAVREFRESGPRFRSAAMSVARWGQCQFFLSSESYCPYQPAPINLHATPHNPNPALSNTDPLLISATASSALPQTFEPPRSTSGTAADLQCRDCEKCILLPLRAKQLAALSAIPVVVVREGVRATQRTTTPAPSCRIEDDGLVIVMAAMVVAAVRLAARATCIPGIVSLSAECIRVV